MVAQRFARPMVESMSDLYDFFVGDAEQGTFLGNVLAHQPIVILVKTALPGSMGIGKEAARLEGLGDGLVAAELRAVIEGRVCTGAARARKESTMASVTFSALLRSTLTKTV